MGSESAEPSVFEANRAGHVLEYGPAPDNELCIAQLNGRPYSREEQRRETGNRDR